MNSTEIKIVEILPDDTGAGIGKSGRDGWTFRLRYRLETGDIEPSVKRLSLLRDAKAFVASLPKAPENAMYAIYQDGRFFGIKTSFWIGPPR
jgi:hypothetical protein